MRTLRKYRLQLAVAAILLFGLLAGRWGWVKTERDLRGELIREAIRWAAAFDAGELRSLSGTPADVGTPGYFLLKSRLKRLRQVDAMVRFVYIFRATSVAGEVVFLADSEPENSNQISLPGDSYPEASGSPGLQEILRTGLPTAEGPLKDEFGVWVTGYAPIADHEGVVREIVGLDIAAYDWMQALWLAALRHAAYIWLLLGLPLAGLTVIRRQLAQREVIRNLFEAMEQSPSAVMIVDLDSRIEYANAGLCRQLGYSRRELIARPWREFRSPQMSDEQIGELSGTVRAGQTWSGEWLSRRRDGFFILSGAV